MEIEPKDPRELQFEEGIQRLKKISSYLEQFYNVKQRFQNQLEVVKETPETSFEKKCSLQLKDNLYLAIYYYEFQDGLRMCTEQIFSDQLTQDRIDQVANVIRSKLG